MWNIGNLAHNIYESLFKKYMYKNDIEQGTVESGYGLKEIVIHKFVW
jgi:hypothetical protein